MECGCIAVERLLLQKDVPLPTREDHGWSHLQIRGTAVDLPVGNSISSVCLPSSCNIFRASSRCNDTVFGFMESVVLRKPLTTFGFETRISDELFNHIVPEMASRLSGFRALASCDCCKRGSVRLVLRCWLSGVMELFLNWNPSPWDMRNLEIEVWMSVQLCYSQGRKSLINKG